MDLLFGHKEDLFKNQAKLNKNVGLSIHVLSGLVTFLNGSFTKIKKTEQGEVQIEFTLPFESIKTNNFTSVYSPKIRGTAKRSFVNGNIVMASPITGFRNFSPKRNSKAPSNDNRISSIRDTIRNVESFVGEEFLTRKK